ncbi:MAG: hypothetical protein FWC89_11030 [Defluviitaleaceae bacterium]|nr:hypothetical protein [Defluviitaleaceae bacterium]
MAKMLCKCGKILSTTRAPNDVQLRVYTDEEWDTMMADDVIEPWKLPSPTYDVWRCPECERLYFFGGGYTPAIKVYALEEDSPCDNNVS